MVILKNLFKEVKSKFCLSFLHLHELLSALTLHEYNEMFPLGHESKLESSVPYFLGCGRYCAEDYSYQSLYAV